MACPLGGGEAWEASSYGSQGGDLGAEVLGGVGISEGLLLWRTNITSEPSYPEVMEHKRLI